MARIRSIHPGFFTDEAVMELTVECPIALPLLIGLWCEADDFGAFEWKPIVLKARYLAATSENVGALLDRLVALNFIRRFEIGGRALGVVRNFLKYQRPRHPKGLWPTTPETLAYAGNGLGEPGAEIDGDERPPLPQNAEIAPRVEEEEGGGRRERSPSASRGREREATPGEPAEAPNVVPIAGLGGLGRDALEAECRLLMGELPVVVDPDFGPVRRLIAEGLTRADVLAGLSAARERADFRPRGWRQLENWIRRAAKDRIEGELPRIRAGPAARRSAKPTSLSILQQVAYGPDPRPFGEPETHAGAGPRLPGRAGAL